MNEEAENVLKFEEAKLTWEMLSCSEKGDGNISHSTIRPSSKPPRLQEKEMRQKSLVGLLPATFTPVRFNAGLNPPGQQSLVICSKD